MHAHRHITLRRVILVCTLLGGILFEAGHSPVLAHVRGLQEMDNLGRDTIPARDSLPVEDSVALQPDSLRRTAVDTTGALRVETITMEDTIYVEEPTRHVFLGEDTVICPGMVIQLHAGEGFLHYQWSTGDTTESIIAGAGNYQVVTIDSIAQYTSNTRQIRVASRPELGITSRPIDCKHAAAVLTLHPDGGAGAPYAFALEGSAFTRNPLFPGMAPGDYVFRVRDSLGCLSTPETFTVKGFPERTLLTSATASGAHCPGSDDGSIQVNIDHGTPPFTFALDGQVARSNNVFSHVFAGAHTIIVQSDFCADTLQVTVSGRPPLHFSPTVGDETALRNGRIALRPGGGTPPYDISWEHVPLKDTLLEHLPAGTYTVHLTDDFGCGADTSIVVRSKLPVPALAENKSKKGRDARKK